MSELEKPQAYLSADFGEHGGHYEWMTHEEAMTWITQLQDQWSWISQQSHNPPNQAWQAIANPLVNATNTLQQAQNLRNQGQIESANSHVALAGSILEEFIRGNSWLLPKAAQRKFVEELRDAGKPLESALIVCHWMKLDLSGAPIQSVVSGLLQWNSTSAVSRIG